jgi:anti-sigma B factor antagonist
MEVAVATKAVGMGIFVVSARGEVDIATAPELERALHKTVELAAARVIVDLTETTFFDSSALRALVRGQDELHASGAEICVVCSECSILQVFKITGLDTVFQIHPTFEQAVPTDVPARMERVRAPLERVVPAGQAPAPASSH